MDVAVEEFSSLPFPAPAQSRGTSGFKTVNETNEDNYLRQRIDGDCIFGNETGSV